MSQGARILLIAISMCVFAHNITYIPRVYTIIYVALFARHQCHILMVSLYQLACNVLCLVLTVHVRCCQLAYGYVWHRSSTAPDRIRY